MSRPKPKKHHGRSPAEQTILDLQEKNAELKTELRIEKQQRKQDQALEAQFRTTAWNELLVEFPALKRLVQVCRDYRLAAHPLRGAPSEDTMRTEHPDSTTVESAALSGRAQRDRADVDYVNQRIWELARRLDDKLAGKDEKKPQVEKPRCYRRGCGWYGRRQQVGQKVCGECGHPLSVAA